MDKLYRQLSKLQADQYNKIRQNYCVASEQKIIELCLKYYLDYRNESQHHSHNVSNQKIQLAMKCAYFLAQKSQQTVNMKGQRIRGISFSLNKLLKDFKLDDTMCMLKQFQKNVKIQDKDTYHYLSNIIKQISFLYTLHAKFDKTIEKLQLKQRPGYENMGNGNNYLSLFKSYAWILFIESKNKLLKKTVELLPNTYMIAHIITWMLIYSWDYVRPQAIVKVMRERRINQNTSSAKQINRVIKQKLLQHFCIKDLSQYAKIAKIFEQHYQQMIENNQIKIKNQDESDFLSPENIMTNYRRLDTSYQKNIDPQDLDERIFVKQRTCNYTPTKFTPFARQGYLNKLSKPSGITQNQNIGNKFPSCLNPTISKQQTFTSHRILNYEQLQSQTTNSNTATTISKTAHQIKLPKNIMQSPSMVKVPLICSTPVTAGMEMYNYLKEKTKKIRDIYTGHHTTGNNVNSHSQGGREFDRKAISYIEKVFMLDQGRQIDEKAQQVKKQTIFALYKITTEEYLTHCQSHRDTNSQTRQKQYQNHELMKAFLALSIQLVFFVSNQKLEFEDIEAELKVNSFEMWKVVSHFLKSDKAIPTTLKLHLLDLQVNLMSYKIWRSSDMVKALTGIANKNCQEQSPQTNDINQLFKRTLHQIAFQITRLSSILQLDEATSQKVFETMKQLLLSSAQLLHMRHIDQLIMCAIYSIIKLFKFKEQGRQLKFNHIQNVYKDSNPNLKNIMQWILMEVYISNQCTEGNIIQFYNQVFIANPSVRQFIISLKEQNNNGNQNVPVKNSKKNVILMSPLKAIIPKQINFRSHQNGLNNNRGNTTPQTQLLYAYNQSPILKYEVSSFRGTLKTKKVLNYEQQEERVRNQHDDQQSWSPISNTPAITIVKQQQPPKISPPQNNQLQSHHHHQPINATPGITNVTGASSVATNQFITKKFGRNKLLSNNNNGINQKQNINNTAVTPTNSHRSLFDHNTTDKKDICMANNSGMQGKNIGQDDTWYKGKTSQIGTYK